MIAGPTVRGRAAIAAAFDAMRARFSDPRVVVGRRWRSGRTDVVELALLARYGSRPIGIAAAMVASLDTAGAITRARLYIDLPTLVAQMDPARLPAGVTGRAPIRGVVNGTRAVASTGAAAEAANLATAAASWARLDAHDPAGVLAASAPGYQYEDYSGPASLDLAGTRELLDRFLGMVHDFRIVEKPTFFAAGEVVITESVETMTFQGRSIVLHALDIKELADGKVVREWQYANGAEVLTALLGVTIEVAFGANAGS